MANNKSKVLITGGEGFVGSHLVPRLISENYNVITTSKTKSSKENFVYQLDIKNNSEVSSLIRSQKPDYLIHLAAISSPIEKDISSIYDINLLGSLNILENIKQHAPECKVLLVSSGYVYGNYDKPITESFPALPFNHYGISKLAMEKLALAYKDSIKSIIIARPFNHIGKGQSENFVISKIINTLKRQRVNNEKYVLELGNIEAVRDFTSVNNVIDAYINLMKNGKHLRIYNVSSNKGYSIKDSIKILERILGSEIEIVRNQKFMRPSDIPILIGDNSKIFEEIGWQPIMTFTDILKKMIRN